MMTTRLVLCAALSIISMAAPNRGEPSSACMGFPGIVGLGDTAGLDSLREGFFSEKEYYQSPVDNYRRYPVCNPDREPPGYWELLKRKKPEPVIDTEHIGPSFDRIAPGKFFGMDSMCPRRVSMIRNPLHSRPLENMLA